MAKCCGLIFFLLNNTINNVCKIDVRRHMVKSEYIDLYVLMRGNLF